MNAQVTCSVLCALLVASSGACQGKREVPPVLVRDSAGIGIVENRVPHAGLQDWKVASTPRITHGEGRADPGWFLQAVVDGIILPNSGIAIADAGLKRIRVLDSSGKVTAEFLEEGHGPAEVKDLGSIQALENGNLLISDRQRRRILEATPTGNLVRGLAIPGRVPGRPRALVGLLSDGTVVSTETQSTLSRGRTGLQRGTRELYFSPPPNFLSELALAVPGKETLVASEGLGASANRIPLPNDTYLAVSKDHVYLSDSAEREINILDSAGALIRMIRWSGLQEDPPEADVGDAIEDWMSGLSEGGKRRLSHIFRENLPSDRPLPKHGRILTDPLGKVWLKDGPFGDDQSGDWIVFREDGQALARASIPVGSTLLDVATDEVLLLETDQFDVQVIAVYPLIKVGS